MADIHLAYLLLGTNQGNRHLLLDDANLLIEQQIGHILRASSHHETAPEGAFVEYANGLSVPSFVNQALLVQTALSPFDLLHATQNIEQMLGRAAHTPLFANGKRLYSSRTMDIDIIFYDNLILNTDDLVIPHPRMHERSFVLLPLSEIAPSYIHPIKNLSVISLLTTFDASPDHLPTISRPSPDQSFT